MKKIFIVHNKGYKAEDKYQNERMQIEQKIIKRFPNEEVIFLEVSNKSSSIDSLKEHLDTLSLADFVAFEPNFMSHEGSIIKICCDEYNIPYMMCPIKQAKGE